MQQRIRRLPAREPNRGIQHRDVGERAVSLGEGCEPVERVLHDAEIGRLVKEIQELKDAREKLESEIAEIRSDV